MDNNPKKKIDTFNMLFNDIIFLFNKLKQKNLLEIFLLIMILPIMWIFIFLYIIIYVFFYMYYIFFYLQKYYKKYILNKNVKHLKYRLIKTQIQNTFGIFLRIMLYDIPKQYSYNNMYNTFFLFKTVKNELNIKNENKTKKNKISKLSKYKKIFNLFNFKIIFIFFIKMLIRWLIIILFMYSFFTIKTSIIFTDSIKKTSQLKIKNKLAFIQCVLFDFAEKYQQIYSDVKKKKIKFLKKEIKFNPVKNIKEGSDKIIKIIKDKITVEINLSKEKLDDLIHAIDNLKNKTNVTYSIFENVETNIKDKSPHITAIIPLEENKSLTIRGTTKKLVRVIEFDDNGDKIIKEMRTHSVYQGSIDPTKQEYKTNIIEIENNDINILQNYKLLKNLQQRPQIKDVFFNGLINSLSEPTYVWEYGNLIKDPKYKNFIEKIENDKNLSNDPIIKESLEIIKNIYRDNLEIIKYEKGDKIFDTVIRILILNKNNHWDNEYIGTIISLLEK